MNEYLIHCREAYQRSLQARQVFEETVRIARENGLTSGQIARVLGWTEAGVRQLATRRGWDESEDQAT